MQGETRATGDRVGRADADLPGRRVGQEFDVLHALAQVVEDRDAALLQCEAVGRRHDAAPPAVDQSHAERVFELGNRLGYGRLRDVEAARRLAHAAGVDQGGEDVEVAQLEATLGALVPGHGPSFRKVM